MDRGVEFAPEAVRERTGLGGYFPDLLGTGDRVSPALFPPVPALTFTSLGPELIAVVPYGW
jgi:hypothetical protein